MAETHWIEFIRSFQYYIVILKRRPAITGKCILYQFQTLTHMATVTKNVVLLLMFNRLLRSNQYHKIQEHGEDLIQIGPLVQAGQILESYTNFFYLAR